MERTACRWGGGREDIDTATVEERRGRGFKLDSRDCPFQRRGRSPAAPFDRHAPLLYRDMGPEASVGTHAIMAGLHIRESGPASASELSSQSKEALDRIKEWSSFTFETLAEEVPGASPVLCHEAGLNLLVRLCG